MIYLSVCLSIRLFVCLFIRIFFFSSPPFFSFSRSSTFLVCLFLFLFLSSPLYILEVLIFSSSRTINPRLNAYRSRRLNHILRNQNRTDHGQTSFSTCGVHTTFKCLIYEVKNVRVIICKNILFFILFNLLSLVFVLVFPSFLFFSFLLYFFYSFIPQPSYSYPYPESRIVSNIPENQLKIPESTNFPLLLLLLLQILILFVVVYIE